MAFAYDDLVVTHQLVVGSEFPSEVLKSGEEKVRGGASFEGPVVIGSPGSWGTQTATLMVGPDTNNDSGSPELNKQIIACGAHNHSPYSLHVDGNAFIENYLDVNLDLNVGSTIRAGLNIESQGDVTAMCGLHKLSTKKNFDIPHPTKQGWRLRHTCTEAPYNDVYIRGVLLNKNEIILPEYWKKFVRLDSITVSITPIGAHQNIFIKRVSPDKIVLDCNKNIPIHCYYQVFAERMDGDTLIPEYRGNSPEDYPGNNQEYTINR
jgi:hypothetical protein